MPDEADRPVLLVVDDSVETLTLVSDILENAGMTALVARSGTAALALIRRTMPDLILMDAVMPPPDGFETCRRIKQDPLSAHIPVVFMTGLSDTEHVVQGFRAGGTDYVTKPLIPDELVARILGHLSSARLAQSARVALDVAGTPLLAVDGAGGVLWMTPASAKLLARLPGGPDPESSYWLKSVAPILAQVVAMRLGKTVLPDSEDGTLIAAYGGEARPGEHLIRLSTNSASGGDAILKQRFDLTGREAEVLYWVAQGKSNRDVAEILSCSPRTVNKHLEQIFEKLEVENRTAAALLATRALAD